MLRPARLLAPALCLFAFNFTASAQQQPAPPKTKKAAAKATPAAAVEADPVAEARRTTAVSLLNSLADDARNFRDQTLRARSQARAADALWETDKERARTLFRRAWEAAEAADAENDRLSEDERRARRAARGSASVRNVPSMRREVLRLAARRDRVLGEEFLGKLDESKKQEGQSATGATAATDASTATQRFNPDEPPPALAQRLSLARQLLEDGDTERAIQFADSALEPVNTLGMNFLDVLREKNRQAADERFASLLARAANNPASDANTVSLLSSYVFTPYLYMTFQPDGNSHTRQWAQTVTPPSNLAPQLRDAFFRSAAQILLRPMPPPEQDRSSAGRAGTYVLIARLTPLFEQHAPALAPRLRTQLAALTPDTPERLRDPNQREMTEGLVPREERGDEVQEALNRLGSAKTADERDEIYLRAAMTAMRGDDATRAREFLDKIEDLDLRKQARSFIDFAAINNAVRDKKAEEAFSLARNGEITNVQRAWGMTEAARLVTKTEPGRAVEMLEAALAEARRIDAASPDRARALVAIVTQLFPVDRPRAWEAMSEVVKASNAAAEFSGEDGGLVARIQLKRGSSTMEMPIQSFNLTEVFTVLARDDFNRAVELARSFTGEYARSVATLAVAGTALAKK
ncbi:MAG TPA: hypothetical protein VM934_16645 [Pyrinomonadaceae bacterium]|nr:hypothetical protein [Pyrinomonadaceae bacterium]